MPNTGGAAGPLLDAAEEWVYSEEGDTAAVADLQVRPARPIFFVLFSILTCDDDDDEMDLLSNGVLFERQNKSIFIITCDETVR